MKEINKEEIIHDDDFVSVLERVEQVEDRMDYLEIPIWKQNKISDIISEIKESKDVEKQENLFKKLVDLLEEDD